MSNLELKRNSSVRNPSEISYVQKSPIRTTNRTPSTVINSPPRSDQAYLNPSTG